MDNTFTAEPTAEETQQIQRTFDEYVAEIEQIRQQMRSSQREIEATRAEVRATLDNMNQMLAQMQGRPHA